MASSDWSALPLDLLGHIAIKMETIEDFIYFSTVCRSWNRASSTIKHLWRATPMPWLLLAENTQDNNPNCIRKIVNLSNNKCYKFPLPETSGARCSGSAYGWVATIDRHLNVQLINPITKARIQFPSLENIPGLHSYDQKIDKTKEDYINWCLSGFVDKLVVLKAVSQSCRHEFVIVVFYSIKSVAMARPGDQSWTLILTDNSNGKMVDVMVMGDQVFGLYNGGRLVYWNANEFFNLEFVKQIDYSPIQRHIFEELYHRIHSIYLIQSGSEFIMALRYKMEVPDETGRDFDYDIVYRTLGFELYKLNPITKLWEEIEELGDEALLLGCNSSMSVSNASRKCLQGGCMYFTDDETQFWHVPKEFAGHDMGVYDIKKNELCRFYEGDDTRSRTGPPTFFIPQL